MPFCCCCCCYCCCWFLKIFWLLQLHDYGWQTFHSNIQLCAAIEESFTFCSHTLVQRNYIFAYVCVYTLLPLRLQSIVISLVKIYYKILALGYLFLKHIYFETHYSLQVYLTQVLFLFIYLSLYRPDDVIYLTKYNKSTLFCSAYNVYVFI